MPQETRRLRLTSPDATCGLARHLAPRLGAGDVLLLSGPVGAGKTHFARCLIRALTTPTEEVPSPTYTLVQTYPGPATDIWHADLYRLTDPAEIVELGLAEAFDAAITLVEWPDRLADMTPETALHLDFAHGTAPETRHLTLRWSDPRWTPRLADAKVHADA
ncbi:tRNA (adenosine(37)-N6)-threonylcarbamoyltransferase complex ATPase subunit type 1 TsaE [Roseovarius sp. A46]|uniref:tRNA (adenosine(37)-N6)-threonylcarbamoyltransferase complex ATPase subunit type 1 TsaE n=1 Tax=Roseovarius sp. A46 TaxID=2109331 RepID=UPI0010103D19|nr:tRNA (adenosine(37)-N6)-threonylcarbamoyltransferase complex ATPase subunit type 1 TsaE [Roseovarius sp. A46]RXV66962.1 tRNA (adenosine(37)-N6)-threonylcarbamoyltransferase complex ATPase subunit type 1 TsaE [Roseovarius sp. A46]